MVPRYLLTLVLVPQGPSWALGPRDTNDGFDSAVQVINHTQTSPKFMGLPDNPQDYYWIELGRGQALEAFMIILQNSTKGYDYNDPGKVNFDLEAYGPLDHTKPLDWSRTWDQFETLSIVAAGKASFAISYGLGQGATVVAALWGVFIWREFRDAPRGTTLLLGLMFAGYTVGLALVIAARVV